MTRIIRQRSVLTALLAIGAQVSVVGATASCKSETKAGDDTSAEAVPAVAEVEPPAAVVAEDPEIPLNEAVVGSAPVPPDYFAADPPPDPVIEEEPARPNPDDVWIKGYWWWSRPLARYVWITGAWRHPPPEQVWYPGSWVLFAPGRYSWSPGYWAPRDFVREAFIETAPPPWRVEVVGTAPEVGMFWMPGYYAFREGTYVWMAGSWARPPVVGMSWVGPRYVSCGTRYYFQPGRWDYAPTARGTVYLPNVNARPGARVSPVVAPAKVVASQATYVSGSANAIAHGGTRTAGGGFTVPSGHGGGGKGGAPTHGGGTETHGGGGATTTHGGAPEGEHGGAAGGTHGGGSPGEHGGEQGGTTHPGAPSGGGTAPHGGTEEHGAASEVHPPAVEHGGATLHAVEPHPSETHGGPPAGGGGGHGGPPPGGGGGHHGSGH